MEILFKGQIWHWKQNICIVFSCTYAQELSIIRVTIGSKHSDCECGTQTPELFRAKCTKSHSLTTCVPMCHFASKQEREREREHLLSSSKVKYDL